MSYDKKSIIKDVNNKPVPQYWNPITQQYEVAQGEDNVLKVNMVDDKGRQVQSQELVDQINSKLDELVLFARLDEVSAQKLVNEVVRNLNKLVEVVK